MRAIKWVIVVIFVHLAIFTSLMSVTGAETKPGKVMPAIIVFDDPENAVSKFAEGKKDKAPFDHDQHVAKEACITCHHTNSEKLTKAMEEEVLKCTECHKADDTKCEIEGTNEKKKFKGLDAIIAKNAYHGDKNKDEKNLAGCMNCHDARKVLPAGSSCNGCHTGEDKIEYKYKK